MATRSLPPLDEPEHDRTRASPEAVREGTLTPGPALPGLLVSPTEPARIRDLGATSSLPERYGADVLFDVAPLGRVGLQRKTLPDLFASIRDGRLTRSVSAMSALDVAVLVIEGEVRWNAEGFAEPTGPTGRPVTSWHRDAYRSLLWSVRARGIWVEVVPDVNGTVATVLSLHRWAGKATHDTLDRRPGRRGADPTALHVLQGLAGIGPRLASRIVEHFEGLPIAWTVTERELASVRGIGPVRAKRLSESLAGQHCRPASDERCGGAPPAASAPP
ncbi:ERCC4 domain-containing protein [Geodermatophilus sp. URMC 65]